MPIRTDETGKRWVEMELVLPAAPEAVWRAMATGPGNGAWFVQSEIEPQVGGKLRFDFGQGATSEGEVTAWEPPLRFGYEERDWAPEAPPVVTEIVITPRSDNRSVMRMIHSIVTPSEKWDADLEGFEVGWRGLFSVLRNYLVHFAEEPAVSFMTMWPASVDALASWQRLTELLGLSGANVGERRALSPEPEGGAGVIAHVYQDEIQRYVLLRLEGAAPGLLLLGTYDKGATSHAAADARTSHVSVCRYFYGDNSVALASETETRWRAWLTESFGAPPATTP